MYCDFSLFLCRVSTCDTGHFVGEVALLQILKMSHQPLSSRRQRAVVPGLSFSLEHTHPALRGDRDSIQAQAYSEYSPLCVCGTRTCVAATNPGGWL